MCIIIVCFAKKFRNSGENPIDYLIYETLIVMPTLVYTLVVHLYEWIQKYNDVKVLTQTLKAIA